LQRLGLEVVMMTGDNRRTAEAVRSRSGSPRVLAEVLPEGKAAEVKRLHRPRRKVVAWSATGSTTRPPLPRPTWGSPSGPARRRHGGQRHHADSGRLRGVVTAIALSKATLRTVKQNLFWAFIYNVIGIPVAAGLLYPVTGGCCRPSSPAWR
jgi:Cu+-exporting ATPase